MPALPPPSIEQPAPRQLSYGLVTGRAARGTTRVVVFANGKRLTSKPLAGRRFTLRVTLPLGDATVRVLTIAHGGRRSAAHVHDVYGVPAGSRPRVVAAREDATLQRQLTRVVRSYPGTAGYYVQSLTGGWGAAWNAKARFPAASTVKLAIAATVLSEYGNVRTNGIRAINIEQGDELIDVQITTGTNDIVLATRHGLSIRFHEQDVREMGRDTTGVKGIELGARDQVIGMVVIKREATLLVVAERGIGKCSPIDDYRVQKRGGKGIITIHRTDKTGDAVSIMEVLPEDELMLMTKQGILIRMPVKGIRVAGRNTQGVKLVNLEASDLVMDVARVVPDDGTELGDDTGETVEVGGPELEDDE